MQKITPFLWFADQAEEAAKFYFSLFSEKFGDSKITALTHYDDESSKASGRPSGTVMTVALQLAGQDFAFINGGGLPEGWSKMSGAISFVVNCQTQEEVDYFWEKLSEGGGEKGICGWINHDKFGVTWQVVPTVLGKFLSDPDPQKSSRVMNAMLKMTKIDIAELKRAYEPAGQLKTGTIGE